MNGVDAPDKYSMCPNCLLSQETAIERRLCAYKHGAAGEERGPASAGKSRVLRLTGTPRKTIRNVGLARCQQVDAENTATGNDGREISGPAEADEKGRRLSRN